MQASKGNKWVGGASRVFAPSLTTAAVALAYPRADTSTVEAAGKCYSTEVTSNEGWKTARQDAEGNAIRTALGITISARTFQGTSESMKGDKPVDFFNLFSELNSTTISGRIISESILDSTLTTESNIPVYSATIQATVARGEGEPDPSFQVGVHLGKHVYYDRGDVDRNDAVHFVISASQNCFLYVFDIMANDSVMLMIPNACFADNTYSAAEGAEGFSEKLAKLLFQLKVGLPPKKDMTTEMIYTVALKKKIDFYSSHVTTESQGIIPTYQSTFVDLQKWLVRIPQGMRTSSSAAFIIKRMQ